MKPNNPTREGVMIKSFVVNVFLIGLKLIGGLLFQSVALIADAFHSLSDFLSDIMVIFGLKQANKPPDQEHPIGHGKVEYVLSLFLGMMILFFVYQLVTHQINRIEEDLSIPSLYALVVIMIVIICKLVLSQYIANWGHTLDSQVLKASAQESFTDVLGSVVVLVGVLMSVLGEHFNIGVLLYADQIAAFVIVLFILRVSVMILIDAIRSLLGKSASKRTLKATKDIAEAIEGVIVVDKLTMIVYGHYYQVLVNIKVDGAISVKAGHDIAQQVKDRLLKEHNIGYVTVHVNPEVD